ncbi:MAG: hypothetical protein HY329_02145 [Chloroflexi bacterium]|nr:hypothetical protein [Chloroflexota bacterium]
MTVLRLLLVVVGAGFRPPALWLGLGGLAIVAAVLALPPLASFAAAWYLPALISLVSWLAMAATQVDLETYRQLRFRGTGNDPYLVGALERRNALKAELGHLKFAGMRAKVEAMIRRVDNELLPGLATRVERHRALQRALKECDQGRGPLVGARPESIAALRRLSDEQKVALDGLLARLSDVNAQLIGLTQEGGQSQAPDLTGEWADEIAAYWQATADVFRSNSLPSDVSGQSLATPTASQRRPRSRGK